MIPLFNIPSYNINTGDFSNLLHDKCVTEFEERFADYVGAKYAVSLSSATAGIFLVMQVMRNQYVDYLGLNLKEASEYRLSISVPLCIPPVVPNAIIASGNRVIFYDDIDWIGSSYILHSQLGYNLIDSAQRLEKGQYKNCKITYKDIMLFSFYPTKPVGSCDGGMLVSDNPDIIEMVRILSFNGTSNTEKSHNRTLQKVGYKMYMNSIQAHLANLNLTAYESKVQKLNLIRNVYNDKFKVDFSEQLSNRKTSNHLYRINVDNRDDLVKILHEMGIQTGIHYYPVGDPYSAKEKTNPMLISMIPSFDFTFSNILYQNLVSQNVVSKKLDKVIDYSNGGESISIIEGKTTLSIPFNEAMTASDAKYVADKILFSASFTLPNS